MCIDIRHFKKVQANFIVTYVETSSETSLTWKKFLLTVVRSFLALWWPCTFRTLAPSWRAQNLVRVRWPNAGALSGGGWPLLEILGAFCGPRIFYGSQFPKVQGLRCQMLCQMSLYDFRNQKDGKSSITNHPEELFSFVRGRSLMRTKGSDPGMDPPIFEF